MAGFFRADSGKSIKTGRINSTRSNTKLQQRPETGRAPNFNQNAGGQTQQSIKPPAKPSGNWNPMNWFKGKGKAAVTKGKAAVKATTTAIKATPAAAKGLAVGAGKVVAPIAAGAVIGEVYKSTDRAPAVSGRGAGRATFRDSNNNNRPNLQANPNPNDDWADPVAGKGPKNNEVGSEVDQSTWSSPTKPAAPAKPAVDTKGDTRTNSNGLVSYGKDLSSLNAFTSAFTGGYELTDIKSAFQSNDLSGAEYNGSNKLSYQDTPYELDSSAKPSNVGGKYSMGSGDISIENTGYKINPSSVPGTVGGNPSDPQDGTSSKPDVAESIRQVRMARSEGSPRGFNGADFSGAEPDNSSLVSPMYANKKRNEIRNAFLDLDKGSVQAVTTARAIAGVGNDSNGTDRYNVGGQLVNAKEGMERKAINAAMSGNNPLEYLEEPVTPDTQPDAPAASELSMTAPIKDMTEDQQKKAAQEFAKGFVSDISGKLKDK